MGFPLAGYADQMLAGLAVSTESDAIARLDGTTVLSQRAASGGLTIPGRISAGGGCRLFDAVGDTVAVNLSRPSDRELLPALFETDALDIFDDEMIAARMARSHASELVARGRLMGMAVAAENESAACPEGPRVGSVTTLVAGPPAGRRSSRGPRVLDLSSLWAGPLAGHLLWLAGAQVVKVESRTRPDGMRAGDNAFYSLLNRGKTRLELDFRHERHRLLSLVAQSDIVIEAARPRALAQLGIDAANLVRTTPGLVWISITAHGATAEPANWVGFGDDCGVSGGLSAALRAATGTGGFVGDAIADPLTGLRAAQVAWEAWKSGRGGRFALAMSRVVAHALARERANPALLKSDLIEWASAVGAPFPTGINRCSDRRSRPMCAR